MELKPGSRWKSAVCEAEFVVVRPASRAISLECGGAPLVGFQDVRPEGGALDEAHSGGSAAGKRYKDEETGLEVLCSKAGAGSLSVDGRPIAAAEAKKLPASD